MEIRVLGPMEVREDGRSIEVTAPKQRMILAELALSAGNVVSADHLIEELWPGGPPAGGSKNLQYHVSKLRDTLASDRDRRERSPVVTRQGGYSLAIASEDVDVFRFEREVLAARRLMEYDPARASARLRDALGLWRGPIPLELLDAPGLELEARRLEELRIGALEDRIDADIATGRHADVIPELERLTNEHPLRERLWAMLMVALYRCDRQGEALRAFDRLRRHLRDQLGIDPSPDLRELEESILDPESEPAIPAALRRPASLRGYRLLEPVGEGTFAMVWRAAQLSVDREVAVKVVRPELSNRPGSVLGFQAQARILAALEHPHVAPVYDFWRDPDGAYLVMPLMLGGPLGGTDTSAWETSRVVAVIEQLAAGLAHAHRLGIVHGDLHPGNILFDGDGNAYLADFGLAINLSGGSSTPPTPYASPEQLHGLPADPISDVYALGRLAWRLFSGSDPAPGSSPTVHVTRTDARSVVDSVLRRATDPDPARRHPDASAFLGDFRRAVGRPTPSAVPSRNPYKGLRAFGEADAPDFFGREGLVEELTRFVADHRMTALVGASGCGKSSVLRAGLLPALQAGALPGSDRWPVAVCYPGRDPLGALTEAARTVAIAPVPDLRVVAGRADAVLRRLVPPDGELLIVIDQFEELFTLTDDEEQRRRFLDLLVGAARDDSSRIRVMLALRADALGFALEHRAFGDVLRTSVVGITPPAPEELARAITEPARRVGVDVDSDLVGDIVGDVSAEPGGLPLMEYALTRLFEERAGPGMDVEGYRRIGGLDEALSGWPEDLYASLDRDLREACRLVFLRMVLVDDAGDVRRRRVPLPELHALGVERSRVDELLDRLEALRLVTRDHDPDSRTPTVEIAHEALLDRWTRLRGWVDEQREALVLQRRFRRAMGEWNAAGRDPDYLLAGGRLRQFETWAEGADLPMSDAERAYLEASAGRDRELRATRRRTRRLVAMTLSVITIVALLFGVAALVQRGRALEQRRLAEAQATAAISEAERADAQAALASAAEVRASEARDLAEAEELVARARGLAAAAMANLDDDPELSVLLAAEAVEATGNTPLREAEEALHAALNANRALSTVAAEQWARTVVYDPEGTSYYIGGRTTGEVIDAGTGTIRSTIDVEVGDGAGNIAVLAVAGRDEELLVVAHYSPALITVLDRDSLEPLFRLEGHATWVTDLAVSEDGIRLASIDPHQGSLFVWDLDTQKRIAEFPLDCDPTCPRGVAISHDGSVVTSGRTVWDVASGRRRLERLVDGPVADVELVGDRMLAADGPTLRMIDLASGVTVRSFTGHAADIGAVAVGPDGTTVASGGADGTILVWDLAGDGSGPVIELPAQQGTVWDVTFSPDGSRLTSLSGRQQLDMDLVSSWPRDWVARTWDITPAGPGEVLAVPVGDGQAAFTPDGLRVAAPLPETGAAVWAVTGDTAIRLSGIAEDSRVVAVALSPTGNDAVVAGVMRAGSGAGPLGWVARFDPTNGTIVEELLPPTPGVEPRVVTFDADGRRLAMVGSGVGFMWDTATWDVELDLSTGSPAVAYTAATFLAGSDYLITQFEPYDTEMGWPTEQLWDLEAGEVLSNLDGAPRAGRGDLASGTNGRLIVSVGTGRPVVSEPFTGRGLTRLEGGASHAISAAFSPDGSRIATGEADGTVRLWDAATGEETLVLEGHSGMVVDVAFDPDGRRLASVGLDGVLRVWALNASELADIARRRVGRDLTDGECRRYVVIGCPPAPGPRRLTPATSDWSDPFGIDATAWATADPGGVWTALGTLDHDGAEGTPMFLPASRRLLFFNGWTGASWSLDLDTWEWNDIASLPAADAAGVATPGPPSYLPDEDLVVVTRLEDGATMGYAPATDGWATLVGPNDAFVGRYGSGVAYDDTAGLVVLFGGAHWGRTDEGAHAGLGDTWVFDVDAGAWTEVTPDVSPPPRIDPAFVYDSHADRIVMFGGHDRFGGDVLGDTWVYDVDAGTWSELDTPVSPPARSGHAAWYDPGAGMTFVFGGAGERTSFPPLPWTALGGEELWGLDLGSGTWTLFRSDPNPGLQLPAAAFFDDVADAAVLVGGDRYDEDRRFQGWIADLWTYRHE